MKIKHFDNKDEQIKWMVENVRELSAQRKATAKEADAFSFMSYAIDEKGEAIKADNPISSDANTLKVVCIINTTGLMDSHSDVHIPGIWKKSLSEQKLFYLVQEHMFNFKGIISDKVKAYTKDYTWKELGQPFNGSTQALVFEAEITKDRNEYMFDQYRKGYVRNHSVCMRYVKDYFCVNSDAYPDQLDNWNKYIGYVANREVAEKQNYFWAQTEAKIIEGSAVVRGSNYATPTIAVTEDKTEADTVTSENEPPPGTQTDAKKDFFNYHI